MAGDRFLRQDPNPVPLDEMAQPDYDVRDFREDADIENIRVALEEDGQLMPVLLGTKADGTYPILDGNHRYLAAKRLGWPALDAIHTGSSVEDDVAQIVANVTRLELSPGEKLATFDYLLNTRGMNQQEAADTVGMSSPHVSKYADVLTGYGEVKEFFVQGELGLNACYHLNLVGSRDRAVDIAETAVREGYHDKDVVEQAKNVRRGAEGDDVMRGAGDEQNMRNRQQVKRNVQQMQDLEGTDTQAVREAQVAPESEATPQEDTELTREQKLDQYGPCAGCGEPLPPQALLVARINPEVAKQLGVSSLQFGPDCMSSFIEWWQRRQSETAATDDGEQAEEPAVPEE
jgi:ParB/RepB/Spo0J family partition protein